MKFKSKKITGISLTKEHPLNNNKIQQVTRKSRLSQHKSGTTRKLTSLTVSKGLSTPENKLKRTTIQWMERYAWHGVFIVSGLFWLVVCGLIWFLSSL
ncbi:hypothetical protein [Serratia quinivorans]|uniref:hypothetical protein n=1 Tax=Serratia quinivorans TaxID=137545 RepID=UPI0021BD2D06|nr:hypothetical protein [Serratia quinivorans]